MVCSFFLKANFLNEMGPSDDCVDREDSHRIVGLFYNHFSCGKVFFINKAIQRSKPGNLVIPHAADMVSVAAGSSCHLLMHVTIIQFKCVLHRF